MVCKGQQSAPKPATCLAHDEQYSRPALINGHPHVTTASPARRQPERGGHRGMGACLIRHELQASPPVVDAEEGIDGDKSRQSPSIIRCVYLVSVMLFLDNRDAAPVIRSPARKCRAGCLHELAIPRARRAPKFHRSECSATIPELGFTEIFRDGHRFKNTSGFADAHVSKTATDGAPAATSWRSVACVR